MTSQDDVFLACWKGEAISHEQLPRDEIDACDELRYGVLDLQDFRKALAKLPDDQREAVILIGASGFSYEEAAEICKCAIGTMKSRVSRARTRLQDILQVSGEADYGPDAVSAQVTSGLV